MGGPGKKGKASEHPFFFSKHTFNAVKFMSSLVILSSFKLECKILLMLMKNLVTNHSNNMSIKMKHPWKTVYHNNDQNTSLMWSTI